MGIRIIDQNKRITVVEPFAKTALTQPCVQFICNTILHQHNLIYSSRKSKKKLPPSDFIIEFSVPAFRHIAKAGNPALQAFAKKIKGNQSIWFSNTVMPLDANMHQCIYSVINYNENETLKNLYLYTRVIDLLRLQQLGYMRINTPQPKFVKTEYDKERIVFARDYLITHMDAPPTLTKLSAIAGINEFKLKRGFKEMFNHTVFGYLADLRLDMARTALRQKQKTVTQIAFELGYASLQHFSAAFKKKFGVSPAKYNVW